MNKLGEVSKKSEIDFLQIFPNFVHYFFNFKVLNYATQSGEVGGGKMRKNSNYWICSIFIKIYCFLLWKYCSKDHENIVRILIRKTIRHEFICQTYIMWLLLRMCLKEIYLIRQNSAARDGDIAPEENLFDYQFCIQPKIVLRAIIAQKASQIYW